MFQCKSWLYPTYNHYIQFLTSVFILFWQGHNFLFIGYYCKTGRKKYHVKLI